jgi:hypothetical protein
VRSGKSVGDDNGWLQTDVFGLSSRAAITDEALLRFPTHLIGEWVPQLGLWADSSVGALDCTLHDNLVDFTGFSDCFEDSVDYLYDVVGAHHDVASRTMWILRTQSTPIVIRWYHVVHALVEPY